MSNLILPPGWRIPDREATPAPLYWGRRKFVKGLGVGLLGAGLGGVGCARPVPGAEGGGEDPLGAAPTGPLSTIPTTDTAHLYPGPRNPDFTLDRALTDRVVAATHNNFYEFTTDKGAVWELTGPFQARPWTVEITGEVERPGVYDVADLEREFGVEERLYRFRCVEAWAMAVPWNGFPLATLIRKVGPLSSARYVSFETFLRPEQAVGQRTQGWYPWPYYEGLRLDEAMNDLSFVATGIYGEPLPKQHGAPIRIVTPWKYGYKSPKSIVRIDFLRERPATFWNDLQPMEYGFYSNVNPRVAHPRWSQATEELIGTGNRVATLPFNGYAPWVENLYTPDIMTRLS